MKSPRKKRSARARTKRSAELDFSAETARQPVHTLYGGAHLFRSDLVPKVGARALESLHTYASDAVSFGTAIGLERLPDGLRHTLYRRIREKLEREPVEDFRIDFEDGFGTRADAEEDSAAQSAAEEFARALVHGALPRRCGIRIKALQPATEKRALRTLELFFATFKRVSKLPLPADFVVTLPKISSASEVKQLVRYLERIERGSRLINQRLKIELMIEMPRVILSAESAAPVLALVKAGKGRCIGAHFGPYDFQAACDIAAAAQSLEHPLCHFVRGLLTIALAGTGVPVADGPTTTMPVPVHRQPADQAERDQNAAAVHRSWKMSYASIRRALAHGIYQGWDLHPHQLPVRFAACYAFFLEDLADAIARLKNFLSQAAQATLVGNVFDDAATAHGLVNFFVRGFDCGAIAEAEVEATGVSIGELRSRSFTRMLGKA